MSQDGLYDYLAHLDCLPRAEAEESYHEELCRVIAESVGDGDALDLLLRDEFMRRKFNLHERAL